MNDKLGKDYRMGELSLEQARELLLERVQRIEEKEEIFLCDAVERVLAEDVIAGNTMMFCFHFGAGGEENVRKAYEVLKEGARSHTPIGPCDYSPCQFTLTDRFGVCWCVFV